MATIKGMPDGLYRRLKTRAAAHRRSLNSEIVGCLEQSVTGKYSAEAWRTLTRDAAWAAPLLHIRRRTPS